MAESNRFPLSQSALLEKIEQYERVCSSGQRRVINFPAVLARLDGDVELLQDLLGFVVADVPTLMEEIQAAVRQSDAKRLLHNAHRLKGLVSNLDAVAVTDVALRLERMGRDGHLDGATAALEELQSEVSRVVDVLEAFQKDEPSGPRAGGQKLD